MRCYCDFTAASQSANQYCAQLAFAVSLVSLKPGLVRRKTYDQNMVNKLLELTDYDLNGLCNYGTASVGKSSMGLDSS